MVTLSTGHGGGDAIGRFWFCSTTGVKTGALNDVCDAPVGFHSLAVYAADTACSLGIADTAISEVAGEEVSNIGSEAGGWLAAGAGLWTRYGSTAGVAAEMLVASVGGAIRHGGSGDLANEAIGNAELACVSVATTDSLRLLSGSSRAVPTKFGLLRDSLVVCRGASAIGGATWFAGNTEGK